MNEQVQELPTREEVVSAMGDELLYDGDKRVVSASDRRIRCAICDAPAGEVTLVKVQAQSVKAKTVAFLAKLSTEGYVCRGGDCAGQRNQAIMRLFKKAANAVATVRRTASGKAMTFSQKNGRASDELAYELTSREVQRRRKVRTQQRASRKANRSK